MPRDQIQEVKDKLDIVAVISSYFPLTKAGRNYRALCPFHTEKTPSFMVSPELQIFKCFGCGEGGDAISFYAKMEGVGYGEALREMAKRAGVELIRRKKTPEEERRERILEINRLAANFFHHLLMKHKVGEVARKYFKKRGLTGKTIDEFDLGYAPASWDSLGNFILSKGYTLTDYLASGLGVKKTSSSGGGRGFYDFLRGRVVFPLRSSTGRIVGFSARTLGKDEPKYINTPETLTFQKRRFLFNLDQAKQEIKRAREVILVEGEMDAITLYERGIKNVVASKGTALTPEQVATLVRFAETLKICFDRDAAGLEATKRGIILAQSVGLEVKAVIPPLGKDPDEAIRRDEKAFRFALEKALPIFDFYLNSALERFDIATPSGKKKVAAGLLPSLKALANEVEKAAYLKKLAEILDVSEESLWRQLAKGQAMDVGRQPSVQTGKLSYPKHRVKREAHFLALVLSLSPTAAKRWLRKLSPDDFTDSSLREIFMVLKGYLAQVKRFRLANFSGKLDKGQREVLEELTLLPSSREPLSAAKNELSETNFTAGERSHEREEELNTVLRLVKRARYRREVRGLVKAVKTAEAEKRPKEVRRLQKEVLKLSEKIRKL